MEQMEGDKDIKAVYHPGKAQLLDLDSSDLYSNFPASQLCNLMKLA